MDTATWIGFTMLIIFLIGLMITIWRDTEREKQI